MNKWVVGARPRTLPASVVPVFVGTACAVGEGGVIVWRAIAALVVALAIQVGTNYQNDVADGVRGTDSVRVGPVRLVASGLATPNQVRKAALVAMLVAAAAGLALAIAVSPWLLLVGALSFLAGYFYTGGPKPYGYYGFGELFVFVFFGLVATIGSAYVQIERITSVAIVAAIPVGFLITALLVANNLRDIPTDGPAGKRTLAVRLGDKRTRWLYCLLILASFLVLPIFGALGRPLAALAYIAIVVARRPVQIVLEGAKGPGLIPVIGRTGRLVLVFGALLAIGLCYVP
ncbi:MAG TPA: 1,4-dihydroxy-2-naphthoate polyprenyltransferase [Acidimicrobiales bacterium]|nr:1,4-dihydroxy-2-naphthoate polyprenyltransferase [Acidimicrobiales bacterium]